MEHFDVLVIGAGLSGIGAAVHLQSRCPGKTYAILEGRAALGGTWDLFRYPGVRSDSDMYTLGYAFRPWREPKAIADGPSIREYLRETAAAYGIDRQIRYGHRVTAIRWSSPSARWTVTVRHGDSTVSITCGFLWMCTGYYRYAQGYTPEFPGSARYRGTIVHPQHWPEDLDYAGKRILVIGSGATAVTLVPALADKAAQVTMLQRSPSYVLSMPATSRIARALEPVLPGALVYRLVRWQRIFLQQLVFKLARVCPRATRRLLLALTRGKLPSGYDVDTHFSPAYNPWEQRLCVVPDGDLYAAIAKGKAAVVTDHIETFTEDGIRLRSGRTLEADIVVTATGLVLESLGGASVTVDDRPVDLGRTFTYKGLGFSGVPNLVSVFGYTNASWTLRADLVSEYVCRLLRYMDERGYAVATPVNRDTSMPPRPFVDFSSGYVQRAVATLPKQGHAPWIHPQDYAQDLLSLRLGAIDDGVMTFERAKPVASAPGGANREDTLAA
jgi:cation diffusion facilitator CzcD-associated flavoprotein CzcO